MDITTLDVAFVADKNYAFPLSACLSSILQNTSPAEHIRFHIACEAMPPNERKKITQSIPKPHAINWILVSSNELNTVVVSEHVTRTSYIRLLLPELLPVDLGQVLYLDCDMIVQDSLLPLWQTPLDSFAFAAVRDRFVQTVDSERGLLNYDSRRIPAGTAYCNAGMLLMNLPIWRRDHLGAKLFEYIREHRASIRWWDQDAINAVLFEQWKEVPETWNYMVTPLVEGFKDDSAYRSAHIVHFATAAKPWQSGYAHPAGDVFWHAAAQSAWPTWTPEKKNFIARLRLAIQNRKRG